MSWPLALLLGLALGWFLGACTASGPPKRERLDFYRFDGSDECYDHDDTDPDRG